ncbi:MAG: orotidine-5'-phosphate decarboxylase [Firmicutes bacterium]|nr:orotidine-5'-phosphate decarboxylase [Bacillota bacterium]
MKREKSMVFIDRLIDRIIVTKNHCIVGIDPHENIIPKYIWDECYNSSMSKAENMGNLIYQMGKEIIDSIYDIVPGIKPQIAFFEQYGSFGIKAFENVCCYAKAKGLIVIADVKRGDIGSTARAYSDYYLGCEDTSLSVDSITVNPYLGRDSIEPFVNNCIDNNKGLFILVKTSNKSSSDIQDRLCNGKRIYEIVSDLIIGLEEKSMGNKGYSSIGAVVGGTYKEEGEHIRKQMKRTYFLVPGFGAQGAKASDLVGFFNDDGLGAIINSSRGIIGAYKLEEYKDKPFAIAARDAAINMRDEINKKLYEAGKVAW